MTIKYDEVNKGDILKMIKPVVGFGEVGTLVRITSVEKEGVHTENSQGESCQFVFNCGADHLEETEWKDDFPS